MSRRGWLAAAAGCVLALVTFGVAAAHAELVSSTPGNQDVLAASPQEIVLRYSESVDPIDPGIRLVDAEGEPVDIGSVDQSLGASTMRAAVTDRLADGTYVVAWQAVSADSHRIRGAFTFSVGEPSPTAPGVVDGLFDGEPEGTGPSLVLGVGRFASYGGIAVLLGSLFVTAALAPSELRRRRATVVLAGATAVASAGTAVMIAAQADLVAGSWFAWGDVAATTSGRWWVARLVAVAVFGAAAIWGRRLPRAVVLAGAGVLGAGVAAVVAAGGHAVAGDHVAVGFVATVAHVLAMAVWLGGLAAIVVIVPRAAMWPTLARFSPWALGAVAALAVTGAVNGWRQLGTLDALTGSTYGRWLVVKVVLVAVVLFVATANRWALSSQHEHDVAPLVRRTVIVELAGMCLVLMATSGLVSSAPPSPPPTTQSASAIEGNRIAQVELDPAVTGGTEMHVYVTSPNGGLDVADDIAVTASLPSADLGPLDLATVDAGPNHVVGPVVDLPIPGEWTFVVTARFGDFEQVVFTVQLPVSSP